MTGGPYRESANGRVDPSELGGVAVIALGLLLLLLIASAGIYDAGRWRGYEDGRDAVCRQYNGPEYHYHEGHGHCVREYEVAGLRGKEE